VYITFRILDFPDMTVDGSFALGGAVSAACIIKGVNPVAACLFAVLAGAIAGMITGILCVKLKIAEIMAGILVMIGLYSINLRIMGKANVPLFNQVTLFTSSIPAVFILLVFAVVSKLLIDLFLKTRLGFMLRATGDNPQMVTSLGVDIGVIKIMGLMIANGLVALSGSLMAQNQGFADAGMETGVIAMGLASIILGESITRGFSFVVPTTIAILGSLLYRGAIAGALRFGLNPSDLKLVTAIIVIIALSLNGKKFHFNLKSIIRTGGDSVASNSKSAKSLQ
jgi:putative ABC transport system permease protein